MSRSILFGIRLNTAQGHIIADIVPHLPSNLHSAVLDALETQRLQRMPNTFLPGKQQGVDSQKEGCFLIGDAWNMRHPLTGGVYEPHIAFEDANSFQVE
jgi:hypothetical protein